MKLPRFKFFALREMNNEIVNAKCTGFYFLPFKFAVVFFTSVKPLEK